MFKVRNCRPLQTIENIQQLMEVNGIYFEFSKYLPIMQFNGREIRDREHQVQVVLDLATEESFYRDGLKSVIRFAINERISADYHALEKKKPADNKQAI